MRALLPGMIFLIAKSAKIEEEDRKVDINSSN